MRLACIQVIFHDFEYADSKKAESILWSAHTYLNTEYRNIVGRLVAQNQVVQKRKLEKLYRDFLKTSQSFYRAYIQRLSGRFYIPELRRAAEGLELEPTETPLRDTSLPQQLREMLVKSCHSSLNHLGDLSRYRCQTSEKISKTAFDTALAHYCVATMVDPDDGAAHHQMAVLYRLIPQHLHIVYHFYRSISIDKPHQLGLDNLEREFKGIRNNQNSKRFSPKDPSEALVEWFVRLHAFYYDGEPFSQQQELEEEVIHRLELAMKAEGFIDILIKMVLTNIAAYSVAKTKVAEAWTANASRHCQFVLRFTIRTICVLLRLLKAGLQDDCGHSIDVEAGTGESPLAFGPVLMKFLPLTRLYIAWLYSLRADLVEYRMYLEFYITDMYKLLADTLTSLNSLVSRTASTIRSQYLLMEDIEAIGLKPFNDQTLPLLMQTELVEGTDPSKRHRTRKAYRQARGRQFKPHTEAIWRIRDIICCGVLLASGPDIPLGLISRIQNGREVELWTYLDENAPQTYVDETGVDCILSKLNLGDSKPLLEVDVPQPSILTQPVLGLGDLTQLPPGALDGAPEEHPRQVEKGKSIDEKSRDPVFDSDLSEDRDMVDMVDKLLGSTDESHPEASRSQVETTYGMNSSTANEVFAQVNSSPAQPSPIAKSIPSLPWDYFYSPTPHRPTSRGQDLPTTDDFYKPRTTVASFENLGSQVKQNGPLRQGHSRYPSRRNVSQGEGHSRASSFGTTTTGMTRLSHKISSGDGFTRPDGADPAAATRKAAHESLASALYAQFGTARKNGQGAAQISSPVSREKSVSRTSVAMAGSSPATYVERPGSRLPDSTSGIPGEKTVDQQSPSSTFSQWADQFLNASSPSMGAFGFKQPTSGAWEASGLSNPSGNQNYTSWLGQEAAAATGSSLAFSHPSSLYMGTPGGGQNQAAPPYHVACNGNYYDATTPFGRVPGYNNREDPAHFRNQLRQTPGEVDDSYDRQILASALLDDSGKPRQDAK